MANHEDLGAYLSFTPISDQMHAIAEILAAQAAQSESEVQALQDKVDALLAAGLDASKALSDRDAEIASLRARVVELEGRVDELVKEKKERIGTTDDLKEKARPYVAKAEKLEAEHTKKMDAHNNPQAGGPEASGDSDKSKSEINDEEGGTENDE